MLDPWVYSSYAYALHSLKFGIYSASNKHFRVLTVLHTFADVHDTDFCVVMNF